MADQNPSPADQAANNVPPKDPPKTVPETKPNHRLFTYIKSNADYDTLKRAIFDAGLIPPVDNIDISGVVLTIACSRDLTKREEDILYKTITSYNPTSPLEKKIQSRISSAMDFGKQIMVEFAAQNVMRGITIDQVNKITNKFAHIQLLLLNGSLYSALQEIQNLKPDDWVRQQDIDTFVKKIKTFLGI